MRVVFAEWPLIGVGRKAKPRRPVLQQEGSKLVRPRLISDVGVELQLD